MRDELRLKAESDVEDIIKNYLKENLNVELDWKGGSSYWSESEKIVIKLLLDGEEILTTTAYKP